MSPRPLPQPEPADDDGSADPVLVAALEAYDTGVGVDADVLSAVSDARLIVPVTARSPRRDGDPEGPAGDKAVDMALPVMIGTDGRRALPAFTSLAAMAAWDSGVRPVPVPSRRAAMGALHEGCAFLVLDPAGPVTWVADLTQVEALAGGRPPVPPGAPQS